MRLGSYYKTLKLIEHVGAYDGYWLSLIDASLKIALDLSPAKSYHDINYVRGDALNKPLKSNNFDIIFTLDVIEHVSDEIKFMNELFRVCKKNGYIIITTPHSDLKIFPSFLTDWIHRKWGHYRKKGYNKSELETLLSSISYKYEIIEFKCINVWFFMKLYLLLRVLWIVSKNTTIKAMKFLVTVENKYFLNRGNWMWIVILKKLR